ncbi:MAG: nucleotide exchange factor GrpE [Anditalea sp.]
MAEKDNLEKEETTKENRSEESVEPQEEELKVEEQIRTAELSDEDKLKAENQELKDKYLRLYSEFENYRRRTAKERLDLIKTASEDVILDMIPIVDDFERSLKTEETEIQSIIEGNHLIYNKLSKVLEDKGLKPVEGLIGTAFDAETQEAITMVPAPTEEMRGKVIDVVEKGYTLGTKVVRYAKVVIGS